MKCHLKDVTQLKAPTPKKNKYIYIYHFSHDTYDSRQVSQEKMKKRKLSGISKNNMFAPFAKERFYLI
jgi:hypothetical protein